MRKDFNIVLKTQRKYMGLTQKQLAEKSGLSEITIRKYENGDRVPKLEQLDKLAQCLDCHVLDFMSPEEQDLFYFDELQIYLTKVLSNVNHPANRIASIILAMLTQIARVAPLNESGITHEEQEYCNIIADVLSQLQTSMDMPDDNFEDYKNLMVSVTNFIRENYKSYFLAHYSEDEGE